MTQASTPGNDNEDLKDALRRATAPNGEAEGEIAADAGAVTLAEKVARQAEPRHIDKEEKAEVAEEASRQSDA